MTTINVTLPEAMKNWIETQVKMNSYGNSSDLVRDLIRRDMERVEKIAHMQALVTEGINSGVSKSSAEEIWKQAKALSAEISG